MRFPSLAVLCLAGIVSALPPAFEKRAEYSEIIFRRVSQVANTMQSLETHLRAGAPVTLDRNRQNDMQATFFRKALTFTDEVTASMREGSAEMLRRIPSSWQMSLGESTTLGTQTLAMQRTITRVLNDWSSLLPVAQALRANRVIADSLAVTQRTTSEFIDHIIAHQNALTSASGLDRGAKSVIESQLSRVVQQYQRG